MVLGIQIRGASVYPSKLCYTSGEEMMNVNPTDNNINL